MAVTYDDDETRLMAHALGLLADLLDTSLSDTPRVTRAVEAISQFGEDQRLAAFELAEQAAQNDSRAPAFAKLHRMVFG